MTDIDRRKFLMGTAAIAAAAAVPSSSIYQTETFQEAERLGLITGSPFCGATMNDWRMATAEEILADIQSHLAAERYNGIGFSPVVLMEKSRQIGVSFTTQQAIKWDYARALLREET